VSPWLAPLALVDVPAVAALAHANAAHIGVGMREPPQDLPGLLAQITRLYLAGVRGDCRVYRIVLDDEVVGLVWWRRQAGETEDWEILIWVAAEHSDRGLGREALRQALLAAEQAGDQRLYARIRIENAASRRIFERSGFHVAQASPFDESAKLIMFCRTI
jgi:RimJ/RimL family protein N-acetyltransferase